MAGSKRIEAVDELKKHGQHPGKQIRPRPTLNIFIEMNAGSGTLTAEVRRAGGNTAKPDDPKSGGTDLTDPVQVEALWQSWVDLREQGYHLVIHFAPTCSTMSVARQRNELSRVRDAEHPWAWPD